MGALLKVFFFYNFIYLFIFAYPGYSLLLGLFFSYGAQAFSLWWLLLQQSTGSRRVGFSSRGLRALGSRAVARRLSCSSACGIFPDQGSNPCLLHWQADSLPLSHRGSPWRHFSKKYIYLLIWLRWVLASSCGIVSLHCSIQDLSCSVWDLVP